MKQIIFTILFWLFLLNSIGAFILTVIGAYITVKYKDEWIYVFMCFVLSLILFLISLIFYQPF